MNIRDPERICLSGGHGWECLSGEGMAGRRNSVCKGREARYRKAPLWAPSADCEVSVLFCLNRGRAGCARREPRIITGTGDQKEDQPTRGVLFFFPHTCLLRRQLLGQEGREDVGSRGHPQGWLRPWALETHSTPPAKESSIAPPRAGSVLIAPFSKTGLGLPRGPSD